MSEPVGLPVSAGSPAPGDADVSRLVAALSSSDGITRQHAREALVTVGHPAVGPLIALLDSRHDHERWEAAKALSEIGDPSSAEALVKTLEDPDAGVRWLAGEGLIRLRKAGLPALYRALIARPGSVWLREGAHHVLHALAKAGLADRVSGVLAALEDIEPEAAVPAAARKALDAAL
jgi:HEAT repeat protein